MKSFIIEQKVTAFANQYRVFTVQDNQKTDLIAFAHQKRLSFKEKISLFADEERQNLLLTIEAEKVMDVHGKFVVLDPKGNRLGVVKKSFKASLFRSTWEILNSDDTVGVVVQERSMPIAIFRRIWGLLPYIGDIPFFVKYHFDFVAASSQTVMASYVKTTRFRDHYRLDIVDESLLETVGWQTLVAQAVLLDALQGR